MNDNSFNQIKLFQSLFKGREDVFAVREFLDDVGFILGIDFDLKDSGSSDELLTLISDVRQELRNNKQYELSDKIRNQLTDLGYEISD